MSGDVLPALAQSAGQAVAAAAATDVWKSVRDRFVRLLGRGDERKTEAAQRWLSQTREQLAAADPGDLELVREAAERWAGRFADLLDEDPSAEAGLRALAEEVAARLPEGAVSASCCSVAARRDVRVTASDMAVAAGVIYGNVTPGNPPPPGPAQI